MGTHPLVICCAGISKNNTEIGQQVQETLARGDLAPAPLVVRMMVERIREFEAEGRGWILDGFPRTIDQAELLALEGWEHVVINMTAPEKVLVERLSQRRVCSDCGINYHLEFSPPPITNHCSCGAELIQRNDDAPQVIQDRLEVYHREIEPLLGWFRDQNYEVLDVDASGPIEEVREEIMSQLSGFSREEIRQAGTMKF